MSASTSTSFHFIASFSFELIVRSATPFSNFVIFAMINVCMICPDALHVFFLGFCHLSRGATHVFLQRGALANSVFRNLVISLSPGAVYFMMPDVRVVSSDPCLF